ncbi:DUF1345 domain-containing protein [Sphingomonas sp.]|uniref:DUF1345 domain-containing protein n=1 Tax=Sphingomonas sp. TaxID=28214 RepID=UPI0025D86C9C|nr:DUF1345 domain-containing protein [Sphingomonas sp.]MBV9528804.1 DUF1345 domain-containing protein [Sphingomonas sp.]
MAKGAGIGNSIAPWRFLLFIGLLIVGVPVLHPALQRWALAGMAAFDVSAAIFLLLCIPLLRTSEAATIREHATQNDANRRILLGVTGVVIAVLLTAITAETIGHNPQPLTKALIIGTLALAWLFSNTVYALHYAHLAYMKPDIGCSGLDFPGTPEPIYWDFVYFAFTCGMAFATSDVAIKDQHIRRVVTVHCLAAFAFNIGVLAFTINVLGASA